MVSEEPASGARSSSTEEESPTTGNRDLTGAIVAGGRSTRFGEVDKAVAPLGGTPMIRRVADRLAGVDDPIDPGGERASGGEPVVRELVINCRADQRPTIEEAMAGHPLSVRYAVDDEPDMGPMAGIRNACRGAAGEYVAVVACDMPFVDPNLIERLHERAHGHEAAVPRIDDRWFQTTQAVYRAEPMASACDRMLATGERKIVEALSELEYVVLDGEEIRAVTSERTFENLNTREDLASAATLIDGNGE